MVAISSKYFIKRVVQTVFMLWLALTFLFFFFRLMPGDFSSFMMYQGASPEAVAEFEEAWGLNDPLYIQYFEYVANLAQGDAGVSIQYRQPVFSMVRGAMFNSFILVGPAITLGYILGSIYGVVAGTNRGAWFEKYGILSLFFVGSFPSFFLSIVLVIVFAGWLGIFPTGGMVAAATRNQFSGSSWWRLYLTKDFLWHYALPFSAIALRYAFLPSLMMRTNVIEVLGQDFIEYQRVTGLPNRKRLYNIAKHSSLPVITLYPISMTRAIGGLILVELVFNWPGIGAILVGGIFHQDFPVIQFVFFLVAAFVILANFAVDIIYGMIDPRVSVGE